MLVFYKDNITIEKVQGSDPVECGEEKRIIEFQIENKYAHTIHIIPNINDEDLHYLEYPTTMAPGQVSTVKLEFSPKKEREDPLKEIMRFKVVID